MKIPKPLIFAGIGAGLMYFLDPDRGDRRREVAKEQLVSAQHSLKDTLNTAAEDVSNRTQGMRVEVKKLLRSAEPLSDEKLIERVKAAIGYTVSNPNAIEVTAQNGRVILSGSIPSSEVNKLLVRTRLVHGVVGIDNQLIALETAGNIPGLQGTAETNL